MFPVVGVMKTKTLKIDITSIELMGTDGWVLLNHASDNVISLITELTPTLTTHLLAKSK
ncbi:hypothetical protein [Colwellia sp. Bg11-28]|nr:hypothetical protein [Colwellia sp. Bg11-28]